MCELHTCATASTHLHFNPLHIWLLKAPYYGNYSLNIASCLPQFNNLLSIRVLLNLSNSLDSWSLSLFIFLILLLFSASFSFSIAGTFLLGVHNWGSYSNLGLCFLLVPLKTHMLCWLIAFHVPLSGFSPLLQSHLCKAKWQYKFASLTLLETQSFLNKYDFPWN